MTARWEDPNNYGPDGVYIPGEPHLSLVPEENPILAKFMTTDQLASIPEPRWLINGVIQTGSLTWLSGAPRAYKSFMAIDWACALSLGLHTCGGRRTSGGNVVYMACEGSSGLRKRTEAWEKATGMHPRVTWLPEAVQIGQRNWQWLTEACVQEKTDLLVIDTYSRATLGLEEINGAEQGPIMAHLHEFRKQTGAAVLAIHHPSASGKPLRGHTILEGEADAIITMVRDDNGVVTMHCNKQKDADEFEDEYYRASLTARSLVLVQTEKPAETTTKSKR